MSWKRFILCISILVVILPGCNRVESSKGPSLEIAIVFPKKADTKAGKEQGATDEEKKIHSLAIWVFRHDDVHTPVGSPLFITDESDFPPEGGIGRYQFDVDWNFVNTHPDVDVFVLANAASIGSTLDGSSTYEDLMDADFGYVNDQKDLFGVSSYTREVPADGLPMSAVKTGMKVYGDAPQLKIDALTLIRAVSRMRIVVCKTYREGDNDVVSIDDISFNQEQIPLREYVFTESSYRIGDTYNPNTFSFGSVASADIKAHPVPENLVYINQNPDEYQAMLDEAVAADKVTDLGYVYLRETDKRLIGRVNYTVNDKQSSQVFAMSAKGDFARNHTWTLLAYFVSGSSLQLSLVADPWRKGDYSVDFSDQAITVTHKFTVDPNTCEVSEQTTGEYREVKLLPGTAAKGYITITTPVGGSLMVRPEGAANLFEVTPQVSIDPNKNSGQVTIEVRQNPKLDVDITQLPESETALTLSFWVSVNGREVSADSEIIDTRYRFHL